MSDTDELQNVLKNQIFVRRNLIEKFHFVLFLIKLTFFIKKKLVSFNLLQDKFVWNIYSSPIFRRKWHPLFLYFYKMNKTYTNPSAATKVSNFSKIRFWDIYWRQNSQLTVITAWNQDNQITLWVNENSISSLLFCTECSSFRTRYWRVFTKTLVITKS